MKRHCVSWTARVCYAKSCGERVGSSLLRLEPPIEAGFSKGGQCHAEKRNPDGYCRWPSGSVVGGDSPPLGRHAEGPGGIRDGPQRPRVVVRHHCAISGPPTPTHSGQGNTTCV